MALFKKEKKSKKEGMEEGLDEIPRLPELPRFPEFSEFGEMSNEPIHQLPSFPNGSLGNKFSRDTIKEAVTGRKGEEGTEADEFPEENWQMMRKPLIKESAEKDFSSKFEKSFSQKDTEPIFVRIDKFEESSKTIEEVKKKVSEMERMFNTIKKIKEDEEREIALWEGEIGKIKEKIEKIDKNIFSKLD